MKKKIKNQFLVYCFFGTVGGFLEIFLFYFLYNFIKFPLIVSNVMAFLVAVIYSYYVNSKYVFKTIFRTKKMIINQFNIFLITRIGGIFIDSSILYLLVNIITVPNLLAKTISCVSTTVVNYYIGKLVFK